MRPLVFLPAPESSGGGGAGASICFGSGTLPPQPQRGIIRAKVAKMEMNVLMMLVIFLVSQPREG